MKKIVFVTNNRHKLKEVREILEGKIDVVSLKDIGCFEEIPEEQDTIKGNALQKAEYVHSKYKIDCFADDTGLEVEALNGEPGVYSARYAGEDCNSKRNINKLLENLEGKDNRSAQFVTYVALIQNNKTYFFDGKIKGEITTIERGECGFGYDSVFLPDDYESTFAEMSDKIKNTISHRGQAIKKLANFLLK